MITCRLALSSALALLTISLSVAQTPATPEIGANPYKSYSGGQIDHIQMQNGSLYLRIPLVSYKQLGKLSLSFSIVANGSQWQEEASCDINGNCYYLYDNPYPGPCATIQEPPDSYIDWATMNGNWTPGSNAQVVVDQDVGVQGCQLQQQVSDSQYYWWDVWAVTDSSEAAHEFGYNANNWSQMQANDGSGYSMSMPCWTSGQAAWTTFCLPTIYDSDGVKHIFNPVPQYAGYPAVTVQDPIGNQIIRSSYSGSSSTPTGMIIDSIQRQIPDPELLPMSTDVSHCPDLGIAGEPAEKSQTWNPPGFGTYYFCYTTVNIATDFFGGDPGSTTYSCDMNEEGNYYCLEWEEAHYAITALQSVVLPNGTHWGFNYASAVSQGQEAYGDLIAVILPSGGSINYEYANIRNCGYVGGPDDSSNYSRAVVKRTVSPLIGSTASQTYQYISPLNGGQENGPSFTIETDALSNDIVHNFTLDYPGQSASVCGAEETSTKWFQGSSNLNTSGTVLAEEDTAYTSQVSPQDTYFDSFRPHIDVLPHQRQKYLNGQLQNTTTYGYDTLFTDAEPYSANEDASYTGIMPTTAPIGIESPTAVSDAISTTVTTRQAAINAAYQAAGMMELPATVSKYDPNGNLIQQTSYAYDDPSCSPQGTYGDLTSITRDYGIKTSWCYNSSAMQTSMTDANSNTTSYTYDSMGVNISKIQEPTTTNGIQHIRYYQQDPNTAWTTAISDENASSISDAGHTTSYIYDQIGRLTQVNYPDGGQFTECYTDEGGPICDLGSAPFSVITQTKQSPSVTLGSSVKYDGLGRQIESVDAGGADVDTTYDLDGRVASVSNPYFSSSGQNGVTSYQYDALGRKTFQCQPDNSPLNSAQCNPTNSYETWTYSGNTATFTDEGGHAWQRTTNAHDRLVQVVEPGSLTTNYTYNSLDDLTNVDQLGNGSSDAPRVRTFTYDALSRLTCASNPENATAPCPSTPGSYTPGTIGYTYDANSNLQTKTDARGITTSYTYDSLNRIVSKSYNDASHTPWICYQYDVSSLNGIGRLANEWTMSPNGLTQNSNFCASGPPGAGGYVSLKSISAYDPMGRAWSETQCTASVCRTANPCQTASGALVSFTYDLAGNLTCYGNGVDMSTFFTQAFDSAGRLQNISRTIGGTPSNLFTAQSFWPHGAWQSAIYGAGSGNGVTLSRTYDDRLRITGETDMGQVVTSPVPGSATVTITGQEQSH